MFKRVVYALKTRSNTWNSRFKRSKSVKMYSLSSTESDLLYLIIVITDKIRFEVLRRFKQSF
jgi:hypothetical protein